MIIIVFHSVTPHRPEKKDLKPKGVCFDISCQIKSRKYFQNIVRHQFGAENPDLLSEDFQFIFPVVGPLPKSEFIEAFSSFKVEEAFTGSYNYFGFNVDPMEPNRVWFFSRGLLSHTGILMFGAMKMKPTGKKVITPPQVLSMSFNEDGQCYKLTGGYSVDRTVGNTGGLGAVFGLIHSIGGKHSSSRFIFLSSVKVEMNNFSAQYVNCLKLILSSKIY